MGDTIVALSTPPGTSGLAILRLSGPACRDIILRHLFQKSTEHSPQNTSKDFPENPFPIPRHVYYGAFRKAGSIIDRMNFVFFEGPKSSTGEDILELYPHGNMLIVDALLNSLLEHPQIRLAEAGEFTRRSFENGKIDLLQAEAIGELIHAQTSDAMQNAQKILGGALSLPLKSLREDLLDLSARLELDVDFSEEEADPDYTTWIPKMEKVLETLDSLGQSFEQGRGLGRARRIAILGAPNAGKSSLINALVQEDRLLVSDIPGTTRDYVDVPLRLPGGLVHLVDTAGLGKPVDGLDELAMQRSRQQKDAADLCIWVEDGTAVAKDVGKQDGRESFDESNLDVTITFALRLLTKADLPGFRGMDRRPDRAEDGTESRTLAGEGEEGVENEIAISSFTGQGLAELRKRLNDLIFVKREDKTAVSLTTERQFRAVMAAKGRVEAGLEEMKLRKHPAIEIIAFEMREAAGHLKELLGEISSDEVLVKIFLGFCIGK